MIIWFWETWAVYTVAVSISGARRTWNESEVEICAPLQSEAFRVRCPAERRAQSRSHLRFRSASRVSRRPRDSAALRSTSTIHFPLQFFLHFLSANLFAIYLFTFDSISISAKYSKHEYSFISNLSYLTKMSKNQPNWEQVYDRVQALKYTMLYMLCYILCYIHAMLFKCFDEFPAPPQSLQSEATMFSA